MKFFFYHLQFGPTQAYVRSTISTDGEVTAQQLVVARVAEGEKQILLVLNFTTC